MEIKTKHSLYHKQINTYKIIIQNINKYVCKKVSFFEEIWQRFFRLTKSSKFPRIRRAVITF